jgi:uncharacterized membrane protein HdeD (DUF308 family)
MGQQATAGIRWGIIATSIISIIMGSTFLASPIFSAIVVSTVMGISFMASGIVEIVACVKGDDSGHRSIAIGIIMVLVGLWACMNPISVQTMLGIMVGVLIFLDAGTSLALGFACLRASVGGGIVIIVCSLILLCLGATIMFSGFSFIMALSGITLILDGIFGIVLAIFFRDQVAQVG